MVDRHRGYTSFFPCFFLSFRLSYNCLLGGLLGFVLSLFSLSLFSHNQPTDSWTRAMMDDALAESDNIFSQSPKQDPAASEVGRHWPLSLFVRSNCCVQSPLSWPPYQQRWACANWSWPHGPAFSKSERQPCHYEQTTFNHISSLRLFSLSLSHKEKTQTWKPNK